MTATTTRSVNSRQHTVIDRMAGGMAVAPEGVAVWLGKWHRYCPRCGTGRLFVGKSLAADGGRWTTSCLNCGYEKDIP